MSASGFNPHEPILHTPSLGGPIPPKRPKLSLLLGIGALFVGGFLFLLQMNRVEINCVLSAIIYIVCICGLLWTFLAHGVPHRGGLVKTIGSIIIMAIGGYFAWMGIKSEYQFQHAPAPAPFVDTNAVNAVATFQALTTAITNSTEDPRIAVLMAEQTPYIQAETNLQNENLELQSEPWSRDIVKRELTNRAQQQSNQLVQQQIQQKIDDINNLKQAKADALTQKQNQIDADQRQKDREKHLNENILPSFNESIEDLNLSLIQYINGSGAKIQTDFKSSSPSLFLSNLEEDGLLKNGTNNIYISIGTNCVWQFEIKMQVDRTKNTLHDSFRYVPQLTISGSEANVIILPMVYFRGGSRGISQNRFARITVQLNTTNTIIPSQSTEQAYKDYSATILENIRHLIEIQDIEIPIIK